jgi:excisionase family DNA binding protein
MTDDITKYLDERMEQIARRVYYEESARNGKQADRPDEDEILDVHCAASLVKLSVSRVYALVGSGQMPTLNPRGTGKLRFSKKQLMEWLVKPPEKNTIQREMTIGLKPLHPCKRKAS